jgi:hypothetical protein
VVVNERFADFPHGNRLANCRVTGITGLTPTELLRVSLIENLRPDGLILTADVATDSSFEVRNVSSETYQANCP